MKNVLIAILAFLLLFFYCKNESNDKESIMGCHSENVDSVEVDTIKCVGDIPTWNDHMRDSVAPGSFAEYLRNLPLKPKGYPTHLYDGREKPNQRAAYRVVDMDIDTVDLQQCADACIRLYSEYLWQSKQYDKIKFHFVSGFLADYECWAHGERIQVNGNRASWYRINYQEDYSYPTFRQYLLMVFTYAGTASLPMDMEMDTVYDDYSLPVPLHIGDVIIQPGSPGHAVIVVDKAKSAFILAQSYMPAQEIEILNSMKGGDAWSTINNYYIITPEWTFDLSRDAKIMRFKSVE